MSKTTEKKNETKKEKEEKVVDVLKEEKPTRKTLEEYKAGIIKEKEREASGVKEEASPAEKQEASPLGAGLKYFEAPDGALVPGEEGKTRIWYRKMNNGAGGWIRPRR